MGGERDDPTKQQATTATTSIIEVRDADDTLLPVPVSPVSTFSEDDFKPPPSTELPSARWRRRGWRTILPLAATTVAAGIGFLILTMRPGDSGLAPFALAAIPIVLGVLAALYPEKQSRHPLGASIARGVLATTITCLLAMPLFGEGAICMIFAMPFLAVTTALSSAISIRFLNKRLQFLDDKFRAALGLLTLLLVPLLAHPLDDALFVDVSDRSVVSSSVTVPWSQEQVWASLQHLEVTFALPSPFSIDALLPIPRALVGDGARIGGVRRVEFDNGIVVATVVDAHEPDRYVIDLALEHPGREFFDHWIALDQSRFDLAAAGPTSTTLTHTTTYRPLLYPRFLFAPIEQCLGGLIQQRLVDTYAADVLSKSRPRPQLAAATNDADP